MAEHWEIMSSDERLDDDRSASDMTESFDGRCYFCLVIFCFDDLFIHV